MEGKIRRGRPGKTYHVTVVVTLPHVGVLNLASTHFKHTNMTYQQLLHLLAKTIELSLAQDVDLVHSSQDYLQASNNVNCSGCDYTGGGWGGGGGVCD